MEVMLGNVGTFEVTFFQHDLQIIDHSEYSFTLLQIGRFADVLVYVSFH
jgi:hypothetical protein